MRGVFSHSGGIQLLDLTDETGWLAQRALMGFADDLGAAVEHALTDTCTHLVAADHTSPKYQVRPRPHSEAFRGSRLIKDGQHAQVALGLGLPILTEEWLSETHRVWMEGGEVSLSEVRPR